MREKEKEREGGRERVRVLLYHKVRGLRKMTVITDCLGDVAQKLTNDYNNTTRI